MELSRVQTLDGWRRGWDSERSQNELTDLMPTITDTCGFRSNLHKPHEHTRMMAWTPTAPANPGTAAGPTSDRRSFGSDELKAQVLEAEAPARTPSLVWWRRTKSYKAGKFARVVP